MSSLLIVGVTSFHDFFLVFLCCVVGFNAATMISSVLTGYLCDVKFLGGWPLAFYIFGECFVSMSLY